MSRMGMLQALTAMALTGAVGVPAEFENAIRAKQRAVHDPDVAAKIRAERAARKAASHIKQKKER